MVRRQAEVGCIIQHPKDGREQARDIWQLTIDWLRKTPAGCDWVKEEIRAVEFRGGRNPPEGAHKAIVSPSELSPSVIYSISFFPVSCLSGFKQPVPLQQPHAAPPRTRHALFIQGKQDRKEANMESTSEGDISDWDSGGSCSSLPNIWLQWRQNEWNGGVVHPDWDRESGWKFMWDMMRIDQGGFSVSVHVLPGSTWVLSSFLPQSNDVHVGDRWIGGSKWTFDMLVLMVSSLC